MKKRIFRFLILAVVVAWMFSACGAKNESAPMGGEEKSKKTEAREAADAPSSPQAEGDKGLAGRMVIRTANLSIRVEKLEKASQNLIGLVQTSGGYIEQASVYSEQEQNSIYKIRVPEKKFMEIIEKIKALGKVERSVLGGEDITQEYTDNESKLRNYEKAEEQYLEIMKKATTIEEIIKIENELTRIREQIEVLTGRIKYLKDQASMATVEVELHEYEGVSESTSPSFGRAFKDAKQGIVNSINMLLGLITFLIVLVGYLIPIAPIVALAWYLIKKYKNRNKKNIKANKQKMVPMSDLSKEGNDNNDQQGS